MLSNKDVASYLKSTFYGIQILLKQSETQQSGSHGSFYSLPGNGSEVDDYIITWI